MDKKDIEKIESVSKKIRRNIVNMIHQAKSGHPGGALSCTDILTVLYECVMKNYPEWTDSINHKNRDRFVLSKGHASAALYSILAHRGYFSEDELPSFRSLHSRLQGHPNTEIPGVEVATGSLGQGLSMACGIAMALKLDKNPAHVFVLLGDGECQEGSVWEAMMNAAHRKLNNLTIIIDRNNLQIDGKTDCIKNLSPLDEKIRAFGLKAVCINGHDVEQIYNALEESKKSETATVIIANTIKGKGVSFMENECGWHGKAPSAEDCQKAICEIGE